MLILSAGLALPPSRPAAQEDRPKDIREEVYERAKASLRDLEEDSASIERYIGSMTEEEKKEVGAIRTQTDEVVRDLMRTNAGRASDLLERLERDCKATSDPDEFNRHCYTRVREAIHQTWRAYLGIVGYGWVAIINRRSGKFRESIRKDYEAAMNEIRQKHREESNAYKTEVRNLRSRVAEQDEAYYVQIGNLYMTVYRQLSAARARLCRLAWKWYDFALLHRPDGIERWEREYYVTIDSHYQAMIDFAWAIYHNFTDEYIRVSSSLGWFVSTSQSPSWASAPQAVWTQDIRPLRRLFPEIETGSLRRFYMNGMTRMPVEAFRRKPGMPERYFVRQVDQSRFDHWEAKRRTYRDLTRQSLGSWKEALAALEALQNQLAEKELESANRVAKLERLKARVRYAETEEAKRASEHQDLVTRLAAARAELDRLVGEMLQDPNDSSVRRRYRAANAKVSALSDRVKQAERKRAEARRSASIELEKVWQGRIVEEKAHNRAEMELASLRLRFEAAKKKAAESEGEFRWSEDVLNRLPDEPPYVKLVALYATDGPERELCCMAEAEFQAGEPHLVRRWNLSFLPGRELTIDIVDSLDLPNGTVREIEVVVGGVKAERVSGRAFTYRIPVGASHRFKADKSGGVLVEIRYR